MTVHFLHIRKTGGTAIAEALRPVAASMESYYTAMARLSDVPRDQQVVFLCGTPCLDL